MPTTPLESYPLTSLQQGMIYHHLLDPHAGVDMEQVVLTLPEALDVEALSTAWATMTGRHPQLRASFEWEGLDEPVQTIHPHVTVPVRHVDLTGLDAAAQDARLHAEVVEERRRGFDLSQPGPQRVVILRFGDLDWRVLWTMHHLVWDGGTLWNLIWELFDLYEAQRAGTPIDLPIPRPYRDFVAWTRAQDFAATEPFWRDRLRGFNAATPLPAAAPNPDVTERHGDADRWLSPETTGALEAAGREHGFTMNILVQAVLAILLARHSGESDIVYGAIRGCRKSTLPEAPEMIGLFINTLPMRVSVDPEASLLDLFGAIRQSWDELRDREHTPLRMVQGWSDVPHGAPLFDTLLSYQPHEIETVLRQRGGFWAKRGFRMYEQPPMGLSLSVWGTGRFYVHMASDRTKIDDDTLNRLADQVVSLFESIAANPLAKVGELSLLPASEREQVVNAFNATSVPVPAATLHSLIAEQARARPDAIALRFGEASVSYAELDRRAAHLAAALRRDGVGPNVIVGLCVERSLDFPVGILGILKAGGAWLPLDPSYPLERLEYMLGDSRAPLLLTQRALRGRAPKAPATRCIEDLLDAPAPAATGNEPTPDDLAYVIYTSGSTGLPKGACLRHRGAVNLAAALGVAFEASAADRILQFSALSFDASVLELVWSLCHGGRLVLAPREVIVSPESLARLIEAEKVTGTLLPPVMLRALDPRAVPSLVAVVSGGDACGADIVDRWAPGRRFYNAYGPTEITVAATVARCEAGTGHAPPIGGPLANCRTYVLDPRGEPVPIGAPGELWIGGAGVGAGYLNRPELTSERFVADPFAGVASAMMYKSGDRVRWRADGQLDYLGRFDNQVKLRGFRIELGEIESRLTALPGVGDAVVALREDEPGEKRLVAYLVPADTAPAPSPVELRRALSEQLPGYMVPAAFVTLDALPTAPGGKVDRRLLPRPGVEDLATDDRAYVAPRTETERKLADLWSQVLRVPRIGIRDNFFDLGGDSILSMQIVARGRPAGLALSPKIVFKYQTIEAIAEALSHAAGDAVATQHAAATGEAPLTPIQRWFFEQELADPHWWNQAFLFALPASLTADALDAALSAVVAHHDALRLRFHRDGESWRQRHAESTTSLRAERVDLAGMPDADIITAISGHATFAQSSLGLANGPLVAAVHFDLGPARGARLLLAVHHLAVDGVSWRLLIEDIESAYRQCLRGETVSLPARTASFKEWSERLSAYAMSDALQRERPYWRSVTSASVTPIPLRHAGEPCLEGDARTIVAALGTEETRTLLQRVPSAYNTRIDDVLVSALATTLARWLGEGSVLVDMEGHGREELFDGVDLSRTVGWFTSVYPVRLALEAGRSAGDGLRAIKEQLRTIPERGVGYGVLRYLAHAPEASADGQLAFNYLGQFDQVVAGSRLFSFASEPAGAWHSPRAARRHPLDVVAMVRGGKLEVCWTHAGRQLDGAVAAKLSADYMTALRELIAHCTAPGAGGYTPSDFPLARLDQSTLDRVLGGRRDVEDIYPLAGVQSLFHGFSDPVSDPGFGQFRFRVAGDLDVAAFRAAWNSVVARHSIFRTAFMSDGLAEPLQVVMRSAEVPVALHDWRHVPQADRAGHAARFLDDDRRQGFAFDRAPLMRLTIIRWGDSSWEVVWSHHHLLLDRWSFPLVLAEVRESYQSARAGRTPELSAPVRFREHVAWIQRQDIGATESYWRGVFRDYRASETLAAAIAASAAPESGATLDLSVSLNAADTALVREFAAGRRVATNTVVQGAWALWLARQHRCDDVVFGLALAGRPADVPGIDRMIGVTISNLPARVRLDRNQPVAKWLAEVQDSQTELQQFAHTPLDRVQAWSGVPWRMRLFESILVFQHHGADEALTTWLGPSLSVEPVRVATTTAYPVTITIGGDRELALQISADARMFNRGDVQYIAGGLRSALATMMTNAGATVGGVLDALPEPRDPAVAAPVAARQAEHVAPRNATEAMLAGIWSELLGVAGIGVRDNFMDRGGHSLLAVQVVSRVRDAFQLQVPVRTLFQAPTIESFAAALRALEKKPGQVDRIAQLTRQVAGMSLDELRQAAARKRAAGQPSVADD